MVLMQGTSDPNPELLDARAMCGHLVGRDSVHWFLACPNGITVAITRRSRQARFTRRCNGCPVRERCTRAVDGKVLTVHEHHVLLAAARAHALTPWFIGPYRQHRPMVERSIAELIRRNGRKVRYRAITRNRIGLAHRCAAVNLRRLINLGIGWDNGWTITA
jgi:hypothetical protein